MLQGIKRSFALVCCCLGLGSLGVSSARAQDPTATFALGSTDIEENQQARVPLSLTSESLVQGLAAIVEWDDSLLEGHAITAAEIIADADVVVSRIESNYAVLGVVVDVDGEGRDAIPANVSVDLATLTLNCVADPAPGETVVAALSFVDGAHASIEGGVALDNIFVTEGLSYRLDEGLTALGADIACRGIEDVEPGEVVFRIEDATTDPISGCAIVDVLMTNPGVEVEGYELAIAHPEGVSLQTISVDNTAAEAAGAEFAIVDISSEGGTLGVIIDVAEPFDGNVIPPGENQAIARFTYCCEAPPIGGADSIDFPLSFVDGVVGDPPKSNVYVAGGLSFTPTLIDGTLTCVAIREICDDGEDNDGDGLIDCDDSDCDASNLCVDSPQVFAVGGRDLDDEGNPTPLTAEVGGEVEISFFYKSPEDNQAGGPQFDQVQGLSLVLCYPCELTCNEDSFDIEGTIVEAVGADFVNFQCDNDPDDGDGCELILAILVDTLPPFDGATLPPTDMFLRLGSASFTVDDDEALVDTCLPLEFCDGANGRGSIPTRNLIAAENHSFRPQVLNSEVCITGDAGDPEVFFRGDCDVSGRLNIVDASAVIFALFGRGVMAFDPPCDDACDCNDDGRLNMVDAACVVLFLFSDGDVPPAPGPGFEGFDMPTLPGPDPTADALGCEMGL